MEHAILLVLAGRRCKNGSQVHTSEPISPLQIDELLCRFRRTLHRNGGWCGERSRFLHVAHSPLTRTATDGSDAHNVGVFRRAVWFVIVIKTDFDNLRLDLLQYICTRSLLIPPFSLASRDYTVYSGSHL